MKIHDLGLCYSGLEGSQRQRAGGFSFFYCQQGRNSTMAPLFPLKRHLVSGDLTRVQNFFAKHKVTSKRDSKVPYINFLKAPRYHDHKQMIRLLEKEGWQRDPRNLVLNVWSRPLELEIPKHFHISVGGFFDKALYRDFWRAMEHNFPGINAEFKIELNRLGRSIDHQLKTIVIYHESGKPAASGLVATKNKSSYLFCGSVNKRYRGRGLWRALVAARQWASIPHGAARWVTSTANPRIRGKSEESFPILIYIKK